METRHKEGWRKVYVLNRTSKKVLADNESSLTITYPTMSCLGVVSTLVTSGGILIREFASSMYGSSSGRGLVFVPMSLGLFTIGWIVGYPTILSKERRNAEEVLRQTRDMHRKLLSLRGEDEEDKYVTYALEDCLKLEMLALSTNVKVLEWYSNTYSSQFEADYPERVEME